MKINLQHDEYNPEEIINLKDKTGINFDLHQSQGIEKQDLARLFCENCLVSNPDLIWVFFNGLYDLGYFNNILTDDKLPSKAQLKQNI